MTVPESRVRRLLAFQLHLCPQSGSARAPASMHTSPSDPGALCKDLWVVCTGNARACLSARTKSPSHVWVHVALGVCTFRVHAARVWVQGAPRARVPARGRSGTHARLQEPRGADPLPAPGRGLRRLAARCFSAITPPSLHPRTPAPPPSHPRARGPRCPPRFRRGRAALRSVPIGWERLCVAAAAAPAPLNVERGREGSLSMGHLSLRQPPPRRRPRPAPRLPPRRLPQPRRRPRPRPGAAPQRARAQPPPPPPPREEPGWSWSTSAISCFQCLALCETEVSLFAFGVLFRAWIAAGTGAGAGAEGGGLAGVGGGRSGHTPEDAGRAVASPLSLLGGPRVWRWPPSWELLQ